MELKPYRVDYTTQTEPDRYGHIYIRAENMTMAKYKVANMAYCDWVVQKITADTEKNYEEWKKIFSR